MLRVGLTGGLGSGKSTVARMLAARGAHVLSADEIGRELMMGRDAVLRDTIVARFGPEILAPDGTLDRAALSQIVFSGGRIEELNAIVHPAVIARQAQWIGEIARADPAAVVVVESALIFETKHGGKNGWQSRFDCILLVAAREELRIERYIERMSGVVGEHQASRLAHEREARRRISYQIPDEQKIAMSDYVLTNNGSVEQLERQVDALWPLLRERARQAS